MAIVIITFALKELLIIVGKLFPDSTINPHINMNLILQISRNDVCLEPPFLTEIKLYH